MAEDALKSTIKINGPKVDVRTGDLRTCVNTDKPKILGTIIAILHDEIIELKANRESQTDESLRLRREYLRAHPRDEAIQEELDDSRADGYEAGLRAFAWWKDGVQYVGTSGTTLAGAIKKGEHGA